MRAAAAILLALTAALPVAAQQRIADPRIELRPGTVPWTQFGEMLNAIGIVSHAIDSAGYHTGSAFIVGRCHALTSRQTAFAGDETARPGPVTFAAGYTGDPQTAWKRVERATIVASGKGPSADWALLRLARCDSRYPRVELGRIDEFDLAGALIHGLGFAAQPRCGVRLMAHINCRPLWHRPDDRFSMTCAVGKGQSGGPVLAQWGAQPRTLVAIGIKTREGLVDSDTTRTEAANPYTSIGPVMSDIEAAIGEDLRRNPAR